MSLGEGTSNNYAYLVVDDKSKDAVIIDPANPPEYVHYLYLIIEHELSNGGWFRGSRKPFKTTKST